MRETFLLVLAVVVMLFGFVYMVNYIDTHGGLQSVSERIWKGKP